MTRWIVTAGNLDIWWSRADRLRWPRTGRGHAALRVPVTWSRSACEACRWPRPAATPVRWPGCG